MEASDSGGTATTAKANQWRIEPGKVSTSKNTGRGTHRDKKEDRRWTVVKERWWGRMRPEVEKKADSDGGAEPKANLLGENAPWGLERVMMVVAQRWDHWSDDWTARARWLKRERRAFSREAYQERER